jgi:hypothetical protein
LGRPSSAAHDMQQLATDGRLAQADGPGGGFWAAAAAAAAAAEGAPPGGGTYCPTGQAVQRSVAESRKVPRLQAGHAPCRALR